MILTVCYTAVIVERAQVPHKMMMHLIQQIASDKAVIARCAPA
jgi:hypothetical protein